MACNRVDSEMGKAPEQQRRPDGVIMDLVKTGFVIFFSPILIWREMDGRDDSQQMNDAKETIGPWTMVICDNQGSSLAVGQLFSHSVVSDSL